MGMPLYGQKSYLQLLNSFLQNLVFIDHFLHKLKCLYMFVCQAFILIILFLSGNPIPCVVTVLHDEKSPEIGGWLVSSMDQKRRDVWGCHATSN